MTLLQILRINKRRRIIQILIIRIERYIKHHRLFITCVVFIPITVYIIFSVFLPYDAVIFKVYGI